MWNELHDSKMSFERHDFQDKKIRGFIYIRSMGFRGESWASMACDFTC